MRIRPLEPYRRSRRHVERSTRPMLGVRAHQRVEVPRAILNQLLELLVNELKVETAVRNLASTAFRGNHWMLRPASRARFALSVQVSLVQTDHVLTETPRFHTPWPAT